MYQFENKPISKSERYQLTMNLFAIGVNDDDFVKRVIIRIAMGECFNKRSLFPSKVIGKAIDSLDSEEIEKLWNALKDEF